MRDDGQATVEVLGLLPLMLIVVLAVGQVLAYGSAREAARAAAHAGALAIAQERDPDAAARAAVPDLRRAALKLKVHSRVVDAAVRPKTIMPGIAALLTAHARADAGAP